MECADIRRLLSEYADGVLAEGQRAFVEKHLKTCKACSEELAVLMALIGKLGSLDKVKPPDDFQAKVRERIARRFEFERMMRGLFTPFRIKVPVAVFATAITFFLVFSAYRYMQPQGHLAKITPLTEESGKREYAEKAEPPIVLAFAMRSEKELFKAGEKEAAALKDRLFRADEVMPVKKEARLTDAAKKSPELTGIIETLGGRILSVNRDEHTGHLWSMRLQIPSEKYYVFVEELKRIGSVKSGREMSPVEKTKPFIAVELIFE